MSEFPEIITSESKFQSLRAECGRLFSLNKRLPDAVFSKPSLMYYAFEHGYVFTQQFADLLIYLAHRSGDVAVNYMTLDPSAEDYYYRNCGFYGAASFSPETLKQRYAGVMSRNGSIDSFQARGGDVGVFWGSSLTWGIVDDRKCWELAVLGASFTVTTPGASVKMFDSVALSCYIRSVYTNNICLASRFLEKFLVNYHFE